MGFWGFGVLRAGFDVYISTIAQSFDRFDMSIVIVPGSGPYQGI